jgi:hypothetical protein
VAKSQHRIKRALSKDKNYMYKAIQKRSSSALVAHGIVDLIASILPPVLEPGRGPVSFNDSRPPRLACVNNNQEFPAASLPDIVKRELKVALKVVCLMLVLS